MAQRLKNNSGFTLVELVIVMLIIGLLSAIAIPSFATYQARAKQAEATSVLSTVFGGEQAYYSEKDEYCDELLKVGFGMSGDAKHYDFTANSNFTVVNNGVWVGKSVVKPALTGNGPPVGAVMFLNALPGVTRAPFTFTAIAAGDIDQDGVYDTWSMNEKGILNNDFNDSL